MTDKMKPLVPLLVALLAFCGGALSGAVSMSGYYRITAPSYTSYEELFHECSFHSQYGYTLCSAQYEVGTEAYSACYTPYSEEMLDCLGEPGRKFRECEAKCPEDPSKPRGKETFCTEACWYAWIVPEEEQ